MTSNTNDTKDSSPKAKILRLFKFLFEVTRLRNRPERTLQAQLLAISLSNLPEHASIQLIRPVQSDGQPSMDFELKVARATTTRCIEPPVIILDWLLTGWDDPTKDAFHAESQNHVNKNERSVTIRFEDDPIRVEAWGEWIATRNAWAAPELKARAALEYFEKLYALHALLEKDGERVELLVADGILNWQVRSTMDLAEVNILHPMLLKRVELSFDPTKPEFKVIETDRDAELYSSVLIDLEGLNAAGIDARQRDLSKAAYHPLGFEDTQAFLTALVQTISPTNGLFLSEPGLGFELYPRMWRDPVLLVRRRMQGVTNAISQIIDDIESKEVFPPAFGQIVGGSEWTGTSGPEAATKEGEVEPPLLPVDSRNVDDDEILLAKEANEQQMQIIRKLEFAGSVLVQGPPGTGKTHTIANIIGHLLSQGKSVLVTSQTPKALRVLRDQIPEDLRPLCVSTAGGDRESRRQLEASIMEINARLAQSSIERLRLQIERHKQERRKILEDNRRLTANLRDALESEYREIKASHNGKPIMPADAARFIKKHASSSNWLPGPVAVDVPPPLSIVELTELYTSNNQFSAAEEIDANYLLPEIDGLPTVPQFRSLVSDINSLIVTDLLFKSELWDPAIFVSSDSLTELLADIGTEFSEHYRKLAWRPFAIVAGIQGGTLSVVWKALATKIMEASELSAQHTLSLHHQPKLSQEIPVVQQCETFDQILLHLNEGGKIGLVQLITKSDWRRLIQSSYVAAGKPTREEHFRALHLSANLARLREEVRELWNKLIAGNGGATFDELGSEPEQSARPVVQEIYRCLAWNHSVWVRLVERLNICGLDFERALFVTPRRTSSTSDYDLAEQAALEILPSIIEAQIRRLRLRECEANITRQIAALADIGEERGCIARIRDAIEQRDVKGYAVALDYTRRIHEIVPLVKTRRSKLATLEIAAPAWAAAIANRVPPHDQQALPGDFGLAWIWAQFHEELNRRHALDAQSIQREIEGNRKLLREVTISLIDLQAWCHQLDRVQANHSVKQALVGWLDTVKRIQSTQKKDILWRLQSAARNLMKLSAKAVPVWIMPLSAVSENFNPATTKFDVVIIDEASQADLNALVAIYQADKVIIVGDHEQVTPEAVGKDQSLVHNLIDTYIRDIPNSRLFDNRFSIYDIGRQSFGDAICLLEHFRCVPEIIAFSNRLSYDGRIRPLRETNSTRLKPACIAYRVHGVAQNQINHKEADTIVDLVRAMCQHPEYTGKTIGIISMVGDNQAILIDQKLRAVLDPVDYERRRIICGNSAHFQGDERHVIFLSMIDSGKEHGLGPIARKGEGAFESTKKRYNVAASRAQDQLWVVHSLDPENDLKPGDMRRDLILHAQNPMSTINLFNQEAPRTESEFERQVLRILVSKGYKVRSQWSVGYYRIDMVVEGEGKRLAVECDGDRWHPIEKLADDMARQAILERLGWTFIRIRGSSFFRNEADAMRPVFERIEELGITPFLPEGQVSDDTSIVKDLELIVAKIHQDDIESPNDTDTIESSLSTPQSADGEVTPVAIEKHTTAQNVAVADAAIVTLSNAPETRAGQKSIAEPKQEAAAQKQNLPLIRVKKGFATENWKAIGRLANFDKVLDVLKHLVPQLKSPSCSKCGEPADLSITPEGIVVTCRKCTKIVRVASETLQMLNDRLAVTCYSCSSLGMKSVGRTFGNILKCQNPNCGSNNTWQAVGERLRLSEPSADGSP